MTDERDLPRDLLLVAAVLAALMLGTTNLIEGYFGIRPRLEGVAMVALTIAVVSLAVSLIVGSRIVRNNDKMWEELNKNPELSLFAIEIESPTNHNDRPTVSLRVRNTGDGTARDLYWRVRLPTALFQGNRIERARLDDVEVSPGEEQIDNYVYRRFKSYHPEPVYPERDVELGTFLAIRREPKVTHQLKWKLWTEAGAFPDGAGEEENSELTI